MTEVIPPIVLMYFYDKTYERKRCNNEKKIEKN